MYLKLSTDVPVATPLEKLETKIYHQTYIVAKCLSLENFIKIFEAVFAI